MIDLISLRERPLVDAMGRAVHDCSSAAPLSWGRRYLADYETNGSQTDLGDAIEKFQRVFQLRGACKDCRAEAERTLFELDVAQ